MMRLALPLLTLTLGVMSSLPALAHDYPTIDRVLYVEDCVEQNPGPGFEMLNKCSCVIDRIAKDLPFDDYVEMSTALSANSISGERGNTIRDTEVMQKKIKRFRTLKAEAEKACFIHSVSPR